jgi:hypothetical protein
MDSRRLCQDHGWVEQQTAGFVATGCQDAGVGSDCDRPEVARPPWRSDRRFGLSGSLGRTDDATNYTPGKRDFAVRSSLPGPRPACARRCCAEEWLSVR